MARQLDTATNAALIIRTMLITVVIERHQGTRKLVYQSMSEAASDVLDPTPVGWQSACPRDSRLFMTNVFDTPHSVTIISTLFSFLVLKPNLSQCSGGGMGREISAFRLSWCPD